MRIYHNLDDFNPVVNAVVTSGTFDGVHVGHQKILERIKELARVIQGETVVITFWPHPRLVLYPNDTDLKLLNTFEEKAALLKENGVQHLLRIPFTKEFSQQSSESFITNILVRKIGTKKLVIGYDHHFGKNREGSFEQLKLNGPRYGFEVEEISRQDVDHITVSSTKIRKQIDDGLVQELGVDNGLNIERIATLKPSLVMGYTLTGDYGQYKKIEALNIPVVMNAEYLEEHPLGRAEWIKFMALFFEKEKEAEMIFNMIETNYLSTRTLVERTTSSPTVLSGVLYGNAWYLPGGNNYNARLLKDAGCHYLWDDDLSKGYLQLSFESVYEKAREAELWIGVASFNSLEEIKLSDNRYTKFSSFQKGKVYSYDARKGAKGGSEYLELGYLRPDIILKDLVKIAHPELLPEYQLYFHKKLE